MPVARISDEALREAARASRTLTEALERLGVQPYGGSRNYLRHRMRHRGIDTSHFDREVKWTRDVLQAAVCASRTRQAPEMARRISNDVLRKAMRTEGVQERCAVCGNPGAWEGEPLKLEVDHIDGDWRDNRLHNLRFLCPNCHATTDTYRGRSRGKQRTSAA
ncbi:HNH endonuclease signature motif containing protein [Streptomyces sp. NPDC047130]|uniref:HNH endonuclease signature motif containing protein n=1 Tax=Streptomyces sp. NPDC047130 TaxID=3155261 RepID=UPI0033C4285D